MIALTSYINLDDCEWRMQNKYVGDVGDFGKYGLLRRITGQTPLMHPDIRLGVHWYLTPDDRGPDGRHIGYLEDRSEFRTCDEPLYESLTALVFQRKARLVSAVETSGLLPQGTNYYSQCLTYDDLPWKGPKTAEERLERRTIWMNEAVEVLGDNEVVFLDPDNGIEIDLNKKHRAKAPKYTFADEIAPFIRKGKTVIFYQHLGMPIGGIDAYLQKSLEQLHENVDLGLTQRPCCCIFKRWGNRAFMILPAGEIGSTVIERSSLMIADEHWSKHFRGIGI